MRETALVYPYILPCSCHPCRGPSPPDTCLHVNGALLDRRAKQMVSPMQTAQNAGKFIRKVAYNARRAAGNENCWWLHEADADANLEAPVMSEAEQRALIESEPAFKTSFLMGFGDPGKMIDELVVLPDVCAAAVTSCIFSGACVAVEDHVQSHELTPPCEPSMRTLCAPCPPTV